MNNRFSLLEENNDIVEEIIAKPKAHKKPSYSRITRTKTVIVENLVSNTEKKESKIDVQRAKIIAQFISANNRKISDQKIENFREEYEDPFINEMYNLYGSSTNLDKETFLRYVFKTQKQ